MPDSHRFRFLQFMKKEFFVMCLIYTVHIIYSIKSKLHSVCVYVYVCVYIYMTTFSFSLNHEHSCAYKVRNSTSRRIKTCASVLHARKVQGNYIANKCKRRLRRKDKDNRTLTCGLKGLCILRASGSPPACENTTRDGGGRWFGGTYAELSI